MLLYDHALNLFLRDGFLDSLLSNIFMTHFLSLCTPASQKLGFHGQSHYRADVFPMRSHEIYDLVWGRRMVNLIILFFSLTLVFGFLPGTFALLPVRRQVSRFAYFSLLFDATHRLDGVRFPVGSFWPCVHSERCLPRFGRSGLEFSIA